MGKRAAIFPAWVQSVAAMAEAAGPSFEVKVTCDRCHSCRTLDREGLLALAEKKGPAYSLINRRSRCRRAGCTGWNRFHYQSGNMRPLWDDRTALRWIGG